MLSQEKSDDIYWLALGIYHEARGEATAGQVAVGLVIMNRTKDPHWPDTVEGVITQNYVRGSKKCAFAFYCDGVVDTPYDKTTWAKTLLLAEQIYSGKYDGLIEGANHYYADWIDEPSWAKNMRKVVKVGNHIFFRGY